MFQLEDILLHLVNDCLQTTHGDLVSTNNRSTSLVCEEGVCVISTTFSGPSSFFYGSVQERVRADTAQCPNDPEYFLSGDSLGLVFSGDLLQWDVFRHMSQPSPSPNLFQMSLFGTYVNSKKYGSCSSVDIVISHTASGKGGKKEIRSEPKKPCDYCRKLHPISFYKKDEQIIWGQSIGTLTIPFLRSTRLNKNKIRGHKFRTSGFFVTTLVLWPLSHSEQHWNIIGILLIISTL